MQPAWLYDRLCFPLNIFNALNELYIYVASRAESSFLKKKFGSNEQLHRRRHWDLKCYFYQEDVSSFLSVIMSATIHLINPVGWGVISVCSLRQSWCHLQLSPPGFPSGSWEGKLKRHLPLPLCAQLVVTHHASCITTWLWLMEPLASELTHYCKMNMQCERELISWSPDDDTATDMFSLEVKMSVKLCSGWGDYSTLIGWTVPFTSL